MAKNKIILGKSNVIMIQATSYITVSLNLR